MSLAQHVSNNEGDDREIIFDEISRLSSGAPLGRRLSFDPLPVVHVADHADTTGAHEVSQNKRIAQVVVGVASCVLASGVVFGYAALKPILVNEGLYRNFCTQKELKHAAGLCYRQGLRLNFAFSIASASTNVSSLPVGTLLDRQGPRFVSLIGCISIALGSILLAFAAEVNIIDLNTLASIFLGVGGTCIFIPSFHLSNAFPRYSGFILALVTGAFDASAAVFLLYRIAYEATSARLSLKIFFLAFLAVPAAIFLAQLLLMPRQSYKTISQLSTKRDRAKDAATDVHLSDDDISDTETLRDVRHSRSEAREETLREIDSLLGGKAEQDLRTEKADGVRVRSGIWGALHGVSASVQMRTPWFWGITALTVLQMLRMNFFIATVRSQYHYLLGSEEGSEAIGDFFDVALPVGGVVSVGFIGFILDHTSEDLVLALLVGLTTLIGVMGTLPFLWAGYVNVVLFVLFRPLYYSAMSDYAAKVFGFATFGRVYGTIIFLSGLFSLAQPLLDALVHDALGGNSTGVNVLLAVLGLVIGGALVGFVAVKGRMVKGEQRRREGESSRQRLLSNGHAHPFTHRHGGEGYGSIVGGDGDLASILETEEEEGEEGEGEEEEGVEGEEEEERVPGNREQEGRLRKGATERWVQGSYKESIAGSVRSRR